MKTEDLKANFINGIPHFRIVIGALVVLIIVVFLLFGGDEKHKHALLMIDFVELSGEKPDTDVVRIKNTIKIGGMLRCGKDGEYIDKIHTIDKTIKDCCAMDSDGNYYVRPSILNWISSKGWRFQQREYVGNGTSRYYFVK